MYFLVIIILNPLTEWNLFFIKCFEEGFHINLFLMWLILITIKIYSNIFRTNFKPVFSMSTFLASTDPFKFIKDSADRVQMNRL